MGMFSLIGGLIGAGKQKRASRKADAAMLGHLDKGIAEQRRQFDVTRADYDPYLRAGTGALDHQGDLVGLNGSEAQAQAIEALRGSPLYQSQYRNGEEAILQNASATGGLRGGNTQRGLADFGADTLSQTIQQQLASLGGLSGRGQEAVGAVSNFGANTANNVTGLLGQQGATKYSGLLHRGGISAGMWRNGGAFLDEAVKDAMMAMGGIPSMGGGRGGPAPTGQSFGSGPGSFLPGYGGQGINVIPQGRFF